MKNIYFLSTTFLLLILMVFISSCRIMIDGKGNIITQRRSLTSFEEIELDNSCNVEIYKDSTLMIEVSDYENIIQYTETKVQGNKLLITTSPDIFIGKSKTKAIIHTPNPLRFINLSGSGDFHLMSDFSDLADLKINGSGNITAEHLCSTNNLTAVVFGSGNIIFQGTANNLILKLLGSGDINFVGTQAHTANCKNSGSGNISLKVSDTLKANISGSGNIDYYGNPIVKQTVSGSGQIIHH
jgi:hypothetical protein